MISLTEKAVAKLKEFADEQGLPLSIRISVRGGSCAGFVQDMILDDLINELDEVFTIEGIQVIVDPMSYQYLDECTIDYQNELMASGFKFINPKTTGSCGCGKSVAF
jgi:iron-sulfur cluster insertion protein